MVVPLVYRICVEGHLDLDWADWFEGMNIRHGARGRSTLTGPVYDQAALYGILAKLRDLGLILVSVNVVECQQPPSTQTER
jgi:hypothetical protein